MGGKAKPTKHTAKEIARKVDLKHTNRTTGSEGIK